MQPPPPPLNLAQFEELISSADVIAVGKIDSVEETESTVGAETRSTVQASLKVERLLKGSNAGVSILIKESYPVFKPIPPAGATEAGNKPDSVVVGMKAGPSSYHGEYSRGARIIVLLQKVDGGDEYQPLGSGSYDKHLCEFLVENDGIKCLYFRFADDLLPYTGSAEQFTNLIIRLCNEASGGGNDA